MTKLFTDILHEPDELSKCLTYAWRTERGVALEKAAQVVRDSSHVYLAGIGSSWNAGWAVQSFFNAAARPCLLMEASEFLHFSAIPKHSTVVVLSRSGKSVEIVRLLDRFKAAQAKVIAITNTPDSPLAEQADVVLNENAPFDNAVSVTMYSALALLGGLLACAANNDLNDGLIQELQASLAAAGRLLGSWRDQIAESTWLDIKAPTYLLARGASIASCHEGRLLWEEGAKLPACAMPTGGFRHGPQEVIREGLRVVLWVDGKKLRNEDLALAADLRKLGVKVMLIGQNLPANAGDLVVNLPSIPAAWQFLIDIIPVQITAEVLASVGKEDCDSFKLCAYIVDDEGGLLPAEPILQSE